jgi:hypothetical protein
VIAPPVLGANSLTTLNTENISFGPSYFMESAPPYRQNLQR